MKSSYLTPKEIAEYNVESGFAKVNRKSIFVFLSAIMAGIFIALGALASATGAYSFTQPGIIKLVSGMIFPVGLMLIVIVGGDLFTSSTMLTVTALEKKITVIGMLKNLFLVYVGNFIGSILIAFVALESGQFDAGKGALGGFAISIAVHKLEASFSEAILSGILCNILVCSAVLMMYAGKDTVSKIFGGFFPIFAFIIAGFQHSVANMYYFSAGILAVHNPEYAAAAHLPAEELEHLNWVNFLIDNLIPVSIGNFIGGGVIVAITYWFLFVKQNKTAVAGSNHSKIVKILGQ